MNTDKNGLREVAHVPKNRRNDRFLAIGLGLAGTTIVYALARATGARPGGWSEGLHCLVFAYFLMWLAYQSLQSCMEICEGDRCRLLCWRTYLFEVVLIWLVEWLCLIH